MNFEQLKTAWQASLAMPPEASELERARREVRASARRYQRAAWLRRIYGSSVFCLALAMLAALILMPGPQIWPGMRVAMALWSASFIVCIIGLWRVRSTGHARPDAPLTAYLESSLRELHREIAYYRALRWTFWLPSGVGLALALLWNPPQPASRNLVLILGTSAIWLWGFIYAHRHWLERFEPQAAQLERMLQDARREDTPLGEDR